MLDRGWEQVRSRSKDELDLPLFAIRSHSRLYEHAETAEQLGPISGADVGMPPRGVFTTALEFDPPLSRFGVDPASVFGVARRHARSAFARSVAEDGLVGVERTDRRWLDRDDGTRARAFRYEVGYPLAPDVFEGSAPPSPTLRSVVWAAIWPTEAAYAMAGGIYSTETLAAAVDRQAPDATPAVDADLGIDPVAHRRELARAIQSATVVR